MPSLAQPTSCRLPQLSRRSFLATAGAAIAAGTAATRSAHGAEPSNVLFILVDDMGWRDLGCYGSTFYETPHIDRLAQGGIRFTNAYAAAPVCSPTRASILTGKYPARLDLTCWIGGSQEPTPYITHLPLEEVTLGEAFAQGGYRTGYIGKWHLGDEPDYNPDNQGFDSVIGNGGSMPRYFYPHRNYWRQEDPPTINLPEGQEGQHLTDRLTDAALNFIDTESDEPFFLYLAYYAPHTPIEGKEHLVEKYRRKAETLGLSTEPEFVPEPVGESESRTRQNDPVYAAMIETLDANVGRLLNRLDERGLAENTVVIFMSDNGGLSTYDARPTSNMPLRAGKAWLYEGGIRVPLIIRCPGRTANSQVSHVPVISTDLYPTLLDLCELPRRPEQHADGITLVPVIDGDAHLPRESLYWHYPHEYPSFAPASAVRIGDFKLVEHFPENRIELFDLSVDPGEQHNLSDSMPEKAAEMYRALREWRESVGANMPVWPSDGDSDSGAT